MKSSIWVFRWTQKSIGGEAADNIVSAQRIEENDKDLLLTTSEKEETRGSTNNGYAYKAPYDSSSTQTELAISNPTAVGRSSQAESSAINDLLGLALPAFYLLNWNLIQKLLWDPSTFQ